MASMDRAESAVRFQVLTCEDGTGGRTGVARAILVVVHVMCTDTMQDSCRQPQISATSHMRPSKANSRCLLDYLGPCCQCTKLQATMTICMRCSMLLMQHKKRRCNLKLAHQLCQAKQLCLAHPARYSQLRLRIRAA